MRILLVFEFASLHGGERSMLAVLDELRARGMLGESVEVIAAASPTGPLAAELARRGIEVLPFETAAAGDRFDRGTLCAALGRIVSRVAPALVHANSLSMGRLTGAIAGDGAVLTSTHLRDILRLNRTSVSHLNQNRLVIAVSQATRDVHVRQGINPDRVRVVYNGVDTTIFQPRPATGRLLRELGRPPGTLLIGTIGQIGLRKGQDVLAAAAVLNARRMPHAHYVLVGRRYSSKAESVAFETGIVERFASGGLGERLHLLGYRNDVGSLMNELDLLVHPAHQEPLGRVLLEAAASGLPIVATDVGGTREILEDGVSARLVPPNDSGALAMAVAELAAQPRKRSDQAAQARRTIEQRFSIACATDELLAAWRSIAG